MRMIVTGGAGFIGSNFIYYMRRVHPDTDVICVDKLTYAGNLETIAPLLGTEHFRFVRADITDRKAMFDLFFEVRPDVVVNFAAESHVDRSIADPEVFIRTNVTGTLVLLEACREFAVSRFHQVSTDEVYGTLPLDRPELSFSENSPLAPSSPYSASKASADLLCMAYRKTFGLPVTISRCSNNYGPYQFPEKLIPLITVHALRDRPLPVYGSGNQVRDWLHVDDHCAALDLILQRGEIGVIYNIGGDCELPNIEIVKRILSELDKPESLICHVPDRLGHDVRYDNDDTRLRWELGWKPKVVFEDGLTQTIRWYAEHRDWWEHIEDGTYRNYNENTIRDMEKAHS